MRSGLRGIGAESFARKGIRQLELGRQRLFWPGILATHQDRKQPLVRINALLVRWRGRPGLFDPFRRLFAIALLREQIRELQPRIAARARLRHGLARQHDRAVEIVSGREEGAGVIQPLLAVFFIHRAVRELAQQLFFRACIASRAVKRRQLKHRLRFLRITRHARLQHGLDHAVQRARLREKQHLLLHFHARLACQQLLQPRRSRRVVASAQIRLAAQENQRRQVAAIVFQPRIEQLRCLRRALMIQQRAHQLPAIIVHLRHRLHQRAQPFHALIHLHGQLKEPRRVQQRMLGRR